jgi:hypothetical protein
MDPDSLVRLGVICRAAEDQQAEPTIGATTIRNQAAEDILIPSVHANEPGVAL